MSSNSTSAVTRQPCRVASVPPVPSMRQLCLRWILDQRGHVRWMSFSLSFPQQLEGVRDGRWVCMRGTLIGNFHCFHVPPFHSQFLGPDLLLVSTGLTESLNSSAPQSGNSTTIVIPTRHQVPSIQISQATEQTTTNSLFPFVANHPLNPGLGGFRSHVSNKVRNPRGSPHCSTRYDSSFSCNGRAMEGQEGLGPQTWGLGRGLSTVIFWSYGWCAMHRSQPEWTI